MKQITRTYIITLLLILIPFILISFILAFLSYFIQLNSFFIQSLIQFFSYFILMISALYFTSKLKTQRVIHALLFALMYFLLSLFIHLGDIHFIHLICKPLLFIIIAIYKQYRAS